MAVTNLLGSTAVFIFFSLALFLEGGQGARGFPPGFELLERAILARAAGNLSGGAGGTADADLAQLEGSSIASTPRSPVRVYPQKGLMKADKILELPGQPRGVNFSQYSGYVTVDEKAGRALFYYFVESPGGIASQKPLVLWLNGGPGCSSLGVGAMMELGPFRVNRDGKTLHTHAYAWNNLANIIFLESPAGVGFSYSKTASDYKQSGDKRTAEDAYAFLVNWLERFPQYKARDLYIVGESYAGHYVPQLAYEVLLNNRTVVNLRGIAIGNGLLDHDSRLKGTLDYYWMRDLISDELHDRLGTSCFSARSNVEDCVVDANEAFSTIGSVYIYDIYAPLCNYTSLTPASGGAAWGVDPCSDAYVTAYLNDPAVQRALHAKPTVWQNCSDVVGYSGYWADSASTVLPIIRSIMANGIRVWIYSGDTDASVPITTSKYAIKKLNLSVETPWQPWYAEGEVGGFAVGYRGLALVTVRGAGHLVPMYQPARALTLFASFLEGKLPPSAA